MPAPILSESEFMHLFETIGPARMRDDYGLSINGIFDRRARLEKKHGRALIPPGNNGLRHPVVKPEHPHRIEIEIFDGVVPIGSDAHYWPGRATTAHRAFVAFCREFKPKCIIMNGDAFDGASISRHPPIGWEGVPTVKEEIEAVQDRLSEIELACGPGTQKIWTLGNHDSRFETRLAQVAPEYAKVNGVHLRDHFPHWQACWSAWINDNVVVKHRHKGGIHATHNSTLWAGKTTVTGHLHSLKVTPFTDYNGTRWGVDTGTLAEPYGKQFVDYCEDNPVNWRSGFVVLTFHEGRLLWPEVVSVFDEDHVEFRGKVYRV